MQAAQAAGCRALPCRRRPHTSRSLHPSRTGQSWGQETQSGRYLSSSFPSLQALISFKLRRDWRGVGQVTRERESADTCDSPAHSFSTRPVCQPCSKGHPGVHAPVPWRLQGVKVPLTWTRSGQTVAWVMVTQEALHGSPRGSDG